MRILRPMILSLLLALFALPNASVAQQKSGADDAQNLLHVADLFYLEGDYYRAITEYKRFLLLYPGSEVQTRVRLKVAWIYAQAKKRAASAGMLRTIIATNEPDTKVAGWTRLHYANVALRANQSEIAKKQFEALLKDCPTLQSPQDSPTKLTSRDCLELTSLAQLGLAKYHIRQNNFAQARQALKSLPPKSSLAPKAANIAAYSANLELPSKSPALAGVLSLVPGLGHLYIEEYSSAFIAALWNGAFIYGFVDSILAEKYGQATAIGLIELIWYSGTIFGAVAGAHRFNRDAESIVQEGMLKDVQALEPKAPWTRRFPVPQPALKLQWTWTFE